MKKLPMDSQQLEQLVKMLDHSVQYYTNSTLSENTLLDLCNDELRLAALMTIYTPLFRLSKQYSLRAQIAFTPTQAIVFITSIIPTDNLTYRDKVKQIVVDYCYDVLKTANIIPNSPTFEPTGSIAPGEAIPFVNKSTTFNDYINE
jgi:hypothetical protein